MSERTTTKKKIAILGGGMAALTAAFELTQTAELRDAHEVTVYQMGWRLGGKGASGRNPRHADRIEEHGLHILMGFYHNTFRLLRACYAELGRAPGTPLATLEEAVKPHGFIVVTEQVSGRWEPWELPFPPLPGLPGEGEGEAPSPLDYLKKLLAWANGVFTASLETRCIAPDLALDVCDVEREIDAPAAADGQGYRGLEAQGADRRSRIEGFVHDLYEGQGRGLVPSAVSLHLAHLLAENDLFDPGPLVWLLRRFSAWMSGAITPHVATSTALRRLWIALELGITTVIGAVEDGVAAAPDGWFSLDDEDLRAWLARHGASAMACDSAIVRAVYEAAFTGPGQAAAGTAIQGALRLCFTYKQAIFQKMQAGMGDTIFAPLYLVLRRRGVRFEFFHRVDELVLSPDRRRIAAVKMGRQAETKAGKYDPLYDVLGLPCWPSSPKFADLEGGPALEASGQNLESWWNTWPDVAPRQLLLGEDFDAVILGIAVGGLPEV